MAHMFVIVTYWLSLHVSPENTSVVITNMSRLPEDCELRLESRVIVAIKRRQRDGELSVALDDDMAVQQGAAEHISYHST